MIAARVATAPGPETCRRALTAADAVVLVAAGLLGAAVYAAVYRLEVLRPLGPLRNLAATLLATIPYVVAVWRCVDADGTRRDLALMLVGLVVLRLAPPLGLLEGSDDAFRYLWDGRMLAHGLNPYSLPPAAKALEPLRDSFFHPSIFMPEARTVYPPLAQLWFFVAYRLSPHGFVGLKLVLLVHEVASVLILTRLLAARGQPRLQALIYAWSPLAVVQLFAAGHLDGLLVPWCLLSLLCAERRPFWAAAALAAATMVRPVMVLCLPALLLRRPLRQMPAVALGFATVSVLLLAPFVGAGSGLTEQLLVYGQHWRFNGSLFHAFEEWLGLDPSTRVSVYYLAGAMVLGSAFLPLARPARYLLALSTYFALAPTVYPWYLLTLAAIGACYPGALVCALPAVITLSDLVFTQKMVGGPWKVPLRAWQLEYALLAFLLLEGAGRAALRRWRQKRVSRIAVTRDYGTTLGVPAMRYVIVGNGVTGVEAAKLLRERDDTAVIVLVSSESRYFYARTALMWAYMRQLQRRELEPHERWFWAEQRLELRHDHAERLDVERKRLVLRSGQELAYDKLLLATGGTAARFGWPGQDLDGVCHLCALADLDRLEAVRRRGIARAVVVGGGLIGIEMVEILHHDHVPTTYLIREPWYWDLALSRQEGEIVQQRLRDAGVDVILEDEIDRIVGDDAGRARELVTKKGVSLPCDVVGIAVGVKANIDLARNAGLACRGGILVDEALRTSAPDVWAAGDCAEIQRGPESPGLNQKLWYTGIRQGRAAAGAMLGDPVAYDPDIPYTSAQFLFLDYVTVGWMNRPPFAPPAALAGPGVTLRPDGTLGLEELFRQVPGLPESIRIAHRADTEQVLGFSMLGARWRAAVLMRWVRERRTLPWVLAHLDEAAFNEEFRPDHLAEVAHA